MADKIVGVSQQTLVSTDGQLSSHGKKLPQYLAGLAATLGALAAGMVLGWSSPAGQDGKNLIEQYNIPMIPEEFSWVGSLATLGAGAMCVPIGILADLIGRRTSMLLMVVPFCVGWLLIIFANTVGMFYAGRFITGVSSGAFCVAAPLYTAEIAESEIRGALGSFFQLLLTIGILLTYVFGSFVSMRVLSIISAVVPLIFFGVFFFMPETPFYYMKKGNEDAARKSLMRLRGLYYDIESEVQMLRESIEETRRNKVSFTVAIQSRAAKKGLVIAFGLMLFQQMSGVNAIIFYASDIFEESGTAIKPNVATIIVGVVQVVAVFASTLFVDRLGRRILLLSSIVTLLVATLVMGIYFYCKHNTDVFNGIEWFAIIPLCLFLIMFNFGFGPLPWMMMAEIFAPEVKGIAASSACLSNWLMAFVVTKFYVNMKHAVEPYGTFWIFSAFCAIGIFFVYFLVPETKGKTLDEIQRELNQG
ncbi:PREDICTED: facilitated trehalose transporter Tret1 isoform X2 [Dinoponera quadriceps]|nr:PREDICTED: facilitated trehalose transporter Tret1 isoform X2 [Dinoponera quadriceps]